MNGVGFRDVSIQNLEIHKSLEPWKIPDASLLLWRPRQVIWNMVIPTDIRSSIFKASLVAWELVQREPRLTQEADCDAPPSQANNSH